MRERRGASSAFWVLEPMMNQLSASHSFSSRVGPRSSASTNRIQHVPLANMDFWIWYEPRIRMYDSQCKNTDHDEFIEVVKASTMALASDSEIRRIFSSGSQTTTKQRSTATVS